MQLTMIGRYEIHGELGCGGFATVHRARDTARGHAVALKVLHPHLATDAETRARFHREAQSLARVTHPNIVRIYEAGEAQGAVFMATELIEGRALNLILRERPALSLDDVLAIAGQIGLALDAIHAAGIVHRDVKPDNILIESGTNRAVLLDLGVARAANSASLTRSNVLIGTPGYMAPEQLSAGAVLSARTDVYQLAATLYTMLAGRLPFDGDAGAVLAAVAHQPPPHLRLARPELPPAVGDVLMLGMAKDPAQRPPFASALVAALRAARDGRPVPVPTVTQAATITAPPASRPAAQAQWPSPYTAYAPAGTAPRQPTRRTPVWIAAGVAALALFGGVALVAADEDGPPAPEPTQQVTAIPTSTRRPSVSPTPVPGGTLAQDNFDNASRGALPRNSDDPARYEYGYEGGEYVIRKVDPAWNNIPATGPSVNAKDMAITVDARLTGNTRNRFIAVACRTNQAGHYRLVVAPDTGSYSLWRYDNTRGSGTALVPVTASAAIKRGTASNRLQLVCKGDGITATVNGTQVAYVEDGTFKEGSVLFGVSSSDQNGNSEARFDNLVVTRP